MDGIVITWQQLLYISLVLLLFYVAELLLFLRKSSRQRSLSASDTDALARQGEEIANLRREVETLKVRLAAMLVHSPAEPSLGAGLHAADDTPYSQAIRLAQQGMDADKVAEQCGISRGEADLIVALYRTTGSSR